MLPHDFDLQISHIQALSNRDAIAAFFAALDYTDTRLPITHAAMGMTGDALAHEITHIERIADHEQGEFQVYLIEMKHVTVALTQAIARALRNRAGNFFLVLTSDYERLDFVLMELTPPESKQTGFGAKQAYLRPRVLTVNRRDPGTVALRVLRRFSYTEIDPLYQWDKLRSAYGIAEWSEPFFDNRGLFADYYLNERMKDSTEWQENPAPTLREFQKLFADVRQRVARQKEAVVRAQLIEPALKALGFAVKPVKSSDSDAAEPDYYLFAGDPSTPPLRGSAQDSKPVAFCDAYVWDRNLDGRDETRDTKTPDEIPGQLVVSLLARDDAPDWVVVTNGKTWRLYSARSHSRATNYYEIDLEEAIASPDPQFAFRYFWLMFRAAAFTPNPPSPFPAREGGEGDRSFLSRLLDESALYAKDLGERLKDRIFEEIFPHFAEGFIADIRTRNLGATLGGRPELDDVFHGTLTFLYRLLFLLYAEARDLLPVREERGYYEISLTRMKKEIAEHAENILDDAPAKIEKAYRATSTELYDRLTRLFTVIDRGEASFNVPIYNGGLFITAPDPDDATPEAANARFLASHKIPDRYLARGLDLMARDLDAKTHALAMIDFKSLGVRQLGSIYEGLLEFKLRVASEKMAVVKGKKTDEIIPYRELGDRRARAVIAKGTVYLENDKRERKATGSYYTPDYIVKYIVQHTVGPVLDEKCEQLRPKLREAQKAYRDAVNRQKVFQKQGMRGDDPDKVADTFRYLVDELFDLRVPDPAMGSGHFLVETVDFITDRMLNFLNAFPWNPIAAALRTTRETILTQMQEQGVSVNPARLTDVNLLKRHVLKRCVYGVDLNPMAVELAKVSLWLDCFTLGAPLSFLDHHLKPGNSLIGAQVERVRSEIEMVQTTKRQRVVASKQEYAVVQKTAMQFEMFGSLWTGAMLATDMMQKVGKLSDVTAAQVKESRAEFRKANDALAPFRRILDVYTSRWFGNEPTKAQSKVGLEPTIDFLRHPEATEWLKDPRTRLKPELQKVAETARQAAGAKKFFHWELEFPEVFFGSSKASAQEIVLKENAGFDAVVGNPPYGMTTDLQTKSFAENQYESTEGRDDTYKLFTEKAHILTNVDGYYSYITPNTILTNRFDARLRELLLKKTTWHRLVTFGYSVFEDPTVHSAVFVIHKHPNSDSTIQILASIANPDMLSGEGASVSQSKFLSDEFYLISATQNSRYDEIVTKLERIGERLGNLVHIRQCIKTGDDEKFLAVSSTSMRLPWRAVLGGSDVTRYCIDWPQRYLKYGPWLARNWQNPDFFERPKLVVRETSERITTALESDNFYLLSTLYSIYYKEEFEGQEKLEYLLVLLNSQLSQFFMQRLVFDLSAGAFTKARTNHYARLPVRRIHFFTPAAQRKARVAVLVAQYERGADADVETLHATSLLLPKDADGTFLAFKPNATGAEEHSDVVHDLLAYLADQMIALNKQKQEEQKRFLGWLEGALNPHPNPPPSRQGRAQAVGIDALTGKTTLRGYLGDYQKGEDAAPFDAIVDVLHKNRTRIGVSADDARFIAKLKAEYDKSLGILLPVKAQLARTDALIDQIVYRLYGLTEEEIRVVEGRQ